MGKVISLGRFVGGSVAFLYVACVALAVLSFGKVEHVVASESAPQVQVAQPVADKQESVVAETADAIPDWAEILTAVIALAGVITAATPTPKDNAVLGVVRKVLDILALNFGGAKNAAAERNRNKLN